MKTKYNKIIILAVFIFSVFTLIPNVDAQNTQNYTVLQPLPGIGDTGGGQITLAQYLPAAFNLTVGIAIALAFIFITIGGITYATSDSLMGKQDGRNYIQNAVVGLLLVIGSYVILYTINPQILTFSIDLLGAPAPTTPTTTNITPTTTPTGNCVGGGCLPFAGTRLPAVGSAVNSGVSASMMPQLLQLNSILCPPNTQNGTCNIPWKISEGGYSPSVQHRSQCHNQGTCIDGGPLNETSSNLNAFYDAARQSGLYPVFEVETPDQCFNLKSRDNRDGTPRRNSDGTPFVPYSGPILVLPPIRGADGVTRRQITGTHFSVYNYNPGRGATTCP